VARPQARGRSHCHDVLLERSVQFTATGLDPWVRCAVRVATAHAFRHGGGRVSTPISIVAVPKPFHGHIATIQRNALGSWTRAPGVAEVILLGDEAGTAEAARAANAVHVPRVALDDDGRPRLDDVFRVAQRTASSAWISYVNADIVLLPALMEAASAAMVALGRALLVSRRWNLDVAGSVAFSPGWDERLRTRALSDGELFTPFGIDVFLYPRGCSSTCRLSRLAL
jgi:hypothetical protein